jgi:hypothetical protein
MIAMLECVISGFQTGADIAGIFAARDHGIPAGGAVPRGFLTEDGPRPDYAELYGATVPCSHDRIGRISIFPR